MKLLIRTLLAVLFSVCFFQLSAYRVVILIHGTWGQYDSWYMPGGDFFDTLLSDVQYSLRIDETVSDDQVATCLVPFIWSGGLGNVYRLNAARALIALMYSYPPDTEFVVIGHSHGANIAIIASQILHDMDSDKKIALLYALGVPVYDPLYRPSMDVIGQLYNFFSLNDFVQPIFGISKREFLPHDRICNIRVTVNGESPTHSQLHDPSVARWIMHVPSLFMQTITDNCIPQLLLLHFNKTVPPHWEIDIKRGALLQLEQENMRRKNLDLECDA